MSRWKAWGEVALLALVFVVLCILSVWAKREVVRQVRQELKDQLAEDVKHLREVAAQHKVELEAQIQQIRAQAAVEVTRDPVVRANELWRILADERALGACSSGTGTDASTTR